MAANQGLKWNGESRVQLIINIEDARSDQDRFWFCECLNDLDKGDDQGVSLSQIAHVSKESLELVVGVAQMLWHNDWLERTDVEDGK